MSKRLIINFHMKALKCQGKRRRYFYPPLIYYVGILSQKFDTLCFKKWAKQHINPLAGHMEKNLHQNCQDKFTKSNVESVSTMTQKFKFTPCQYNIDKKIKFRPTKTVENSYDLCNTKASFIRAFGLTTKKTNKFVYRDKNILTK